MATKQLDFKLSIEDSKFVKNLFESLSTIITSDTIIEITDAEFIIRTMNSSHVAIVDLCLKKEDFNIFEVTNPIKFGVAFLDFVKIIKRGGATDKIIFEGLTEKKLTVRFKTEKKKDRTITLRTIDLSEDGGIIMDTINEVYKNTIEATIKCVDLEEALADAKIVSEVLHTEFKQDKIIFSADGTTGEAQTILEKEEMISFIPAESETFGDYAIDFLNNFMKINKDSLRLNIANEDNRALRLTFDLLNSSHLTYYLASRVDESDNNIGTEQ
jgi:DNA polymerase III sliding clamp (beta) subunit (PCNA family)